MTNSRFRFRAFFEGATFYDDDGNEYTKSFYLYDVALYKELDCGISRDDLEAQLREQCFSEKEIRRIEEDEFDSWDAEWYFFTPSAIEQCTGLRDKNGKLIYEGDIVQTNDQTIGDVKFGKYGGDSWQGWHLGFYIDWIKYRQPCQRKPTLRKDFWFWIKNRELEIVGNINNKELLK